MPAILATWWKSKSLSVKALIIFLFWSALSLLWAFSVPLAVTQLSFLTQALLISGAVMFLFQKKFLSWRAFCVVLTVGGVFESIVGLLQVALGRAVGLGLSHLGEPPLIMADPEVAKTIIGGAGRMLRAYGTFLHPNILGAALVLALLASYFLFFEADAANRQLGRRVVVTAIFLELVGLTLTFSRASWLVWFLATLVFLYHIRKEKGCGRLVVVIGLSIVAVAMIFWWAILPKASFRVDEPSVVLRKTYLAIGWEIIKEQPLFGVGIGNQGLYAVQNDLYQNQGLTEPHLWQPIHNLYVLIASELGLIGLGLFLLFIVSIVKEFIVLEIRYYLPIDVTALQAGKLEILNRFELETIGLMWLSLLVLGLFDHFLWTIPAGLMMFWVINSLLLAFIISSSKMMK